jgi:hypothetical protein
MGARTTRALNMLLDQFTMSPKIIEWYKSYLNRAEEIDDLLASLATLRWLDTAEGVWLDGIGEIVGIDRFYEEFDPDNIFTFKENIVDVDDPDKGFGDTASPGDGGHFQSVYGIYSSTLIDDDAYRVWIKVKIQITNQPGTIDQVYLFIKAAFNGTESHVTTSYPAGTVLVELTTPLTLAQRSQLIRYAPRLGGMGIEITN